MERQVATQPALRVTFSQIEAVLKDLPVGLLPEVYEYLLELLSRQDVPNAALRQAIEDADAGRNVNTYQTVDELFAHINATE